MTVFVEYFINIQTPIFIFHLSQWSKFFCETTHPRLNFVNPKSLIVKHHSKIFGKLA